MRFDSLLVWVAADWLVVPIVALALRGLWGLGRGRRYQAFGRALVMLLVSLLIAKVASVFYTGTRPFQVLGFEPGASYLDNPGFPSDHAVLMFALVIVVWAATKSRRLTMVVFSMAIIVAVARVAAWVHTPVDVAAGIGCAVLAGIFVYGRSLLKIT